jgi:YHS domain-containing protein
MAIGMLAPWAAVVVLVTMGAATVLPWLAHADGAAMLLGMLAVMLLRPHHYAGHGSSHGTPCSPLGGVDGDDQPVTDPVCGMVVDPRTASRTAEYRGQTYYFFAPACRKSFLADPQSVLAPNFLPSM